MFQRIQRSLGLMSESAALLSRNKSLMLFPIVSGLATLLLIISFIVPVWYTGMLSNLAERQGTPGMYLLAFSFYFLSYFIQIYFNCALMAAANQAFAGGNANFADGLGIANMRIGRIFVWALVAATVGWVLRMIEERAGLIGRIIIAVLGSAWSILTYFIAPVIVFEDLGVVDGVQRSASLIKKTWGEGAVKAISFGFALFIGIIVIFVVGFAAIVFVHPAFGVLLTVSLFLLLMIIISTLDGIFKVALYRYATWGVAPDGFDTGLIQSAFQPK